MTVDSRKKQQSDEALRDMLRTGPTRWTKWVARQRVSMQFWRQDGRWGPYSSYRPDHPESSKVGEFDVP